MTLTLQKPAMTGRNASGTYQHLIQYKTFYIWWRLQDYKTVFFIWTVKILLQMMIQAVNEVPLL